MTPRRLSSSSVSARIQPHTLGPALPCVTVIRRMCEAFGVDAPNLLVLSRCEESLQPHTLAAFPEGVARLAVGTYPTHHQRFVDQRADHIENRPSGSNRAVVISILRLLASSRW